ncbi:MAG: molecular chaperone DnaJ [Rickettsiales bacterium]|nr:molecular chaperone DnaJ [Rickettsiales bacterium]
MSSGLYKILGLSQNASDKEIKAAYRRLAKKYHPDVNQNDPKVAAKFQEITAAYDILSDKEKRSQYDSGQIDDQGNQRSPFGAGSGGFGSGGSTSGNPFADAGFDYGGSGGFSTEDIFSSIFGGMGGKRSSYSRSTQHESHSKGADKSFTLKISFLDAALGCVKQINIGGSKPVSLKIPAGTKNNDKLRLKGKGEPGHRGAGQPGDAIIEIMVASHPYFIREDLNIRLDLPLTVYEAALGAKVTIPTIHGKLSVKIPPGSQSGQSLRLKGKGIEKSSDQKGDQIVKLQIMLPEKKIKILMH